MKATADFIRRDLNRFFAGWILAANFLWACTPWLDSLAPTWGAVWLWTVVIPGSSLAALNPRRTLSLLPAAAALSWRALAQLTRPCRFRLQRASVTSTTTRALACPPKPSSIV